MKAIVLAGLCAGLAAAPLVTKAADLVLVDAAGRPLAVVVAPPMMQIQAMPMLPMSGFRSVDFGGIFAQQDAMLRRMMGDMQAGLNGAIPAMDADGGAMVPGSSVMMSSFSDGHGSCSRTVTYRAQPGGGAPVMHVSQSGDACGSLPGGGIGAPASRATTPVAAPEPVAPRPAVPDGTRLYDIDYRHPVKAPAAHRG